MDFAWAVDILRRAAVECMERELRDELRVATLGIQRGPVWRC